MLAAGPLHLPPWVRQRQAFHAKTLLSKKPEPVYRVLVCSVSSLHFVAPPQASDAELLIVGQANGRLQLLTDTGKKKGAIRAHEGEIACVASSESVIATASHDHFLKVWDLGRIGAGEDRALRTLRGHGSYVTSCAFDSFGALVCSTSLDHSVRIWDKSSEECAIRITTDRPCAAASFMPGTQTLVLVAADDGARLYDLRMHSTYKRMEAIFHIEKELQSGSRDVSLPSWYLSDQRIDTVWERQAPAAPRFSSLWASRSAGPRARDAENDMLAPLLRLKTAASGAGSVYDNFSGRYVQKFAGHSAQDAVYHALCTPDSRYILTACCDDTIKAWDAFTGAGVATLTGAHLSPSRPTPVLVSGMVACASSDGVYFWRLPGASSGAPTAASAAHTGGLDGNMLAVVATEQKAAVTAMCASESAGGRYAYATACGAIWVA